MAWGFHMSHMSGFGLILRGHSIFIAFDPDLWGNREPISKLYESSIILERHVHFLFFISSFWCKLDSSRCKHYAISDGFSTTVNNAILLISWKLKGSSCINNPVFLSATEFTLGYMIIKKNDVIGCHFYGSYQQ